MEKQEDAKKGDWFEQLGLAVWIISLVIVSVVFGVWSAQQNHFPAPMIKAAGKAFEGLWFQSIRDTMLRRPGGGPEIEFVPSFQPTPELLLVSGIAEGPTNFIRVMDRTGDVVHEWEPDWFSIWPDDSYLGIDRRPQQPPGAEIHGVVIAPNGDVIFNFEHLSTVRLNACGDVVWKLPNLGHHSVYIADDGNIWVGAEDYFPSGAAGFPGHETPLNSWTLQEISPDGRVLQTLPVIELLLDEGLLGLLYLSTIELDTWVSGDTLHANDVEIFPSDLESEVFEPGDIMVSLRNISTVIVFDGEDHSVKFRSTGPFLRQHDPDFIGDDKILVFDNRDVRLPVEYGGTKSRILVIDAITGSVVPYFENEPSFFTSAMGKAQLLDSGNVLVTSALQGSVFEFDPQGNQVWRYRNRVSDEFNGIVLEGTQLPSYMDRRFFANASARCEEDRP